MDEMQDVVDEVGGRVNEGPWRERGDQEDKRVHAVSYRAKIMRQHLQH